jgi:hypothetical protein
MASVRKPRNPSSVFKGYPLLDFLDPNAFTIDGLFKNATLRAELERYIKGVPSSQEESCGCDKPSKSKRPRPFDIPPKDARNPDGRTAQSVKDRLETFLDGLYLGCFKSSVLQPEARKPPVRYVFDIGFNTDKVTGFIVANPVDTLVTFGPRGRYAGYGAVHPSVRDLPRSPGIRVAEVRQPPRGLDGKAGVANTHYVTTFGLPTEGSNDPRADIVCDLNIRLVFDDRQSLQELSLYGETMKLHLSKGLVQPVQRSEHDEWVRTGKRLRLDMGRRVIRLRRGRLPHWGGPIDLGGALITITATGLIARLHRINLGGTVAKPQIVFDGVEILK